MTASCKTKYQEGRVMGPMKRDGISEDQSGHRQKLENWTASSFFIKSYHSSHSRGRPCSINPIFPHLSGPCQVPLTSWEDMARLGPRGRSGGGDNSGDFIAGPD